MYSFGSACFSRKNQQPPALWQIQLLQVLAIFEKTSNSHYRPRKGMLVWNAKEFFLIFYEIKTQDIKIPDFSLTLIIVKKYYRSFPGSLIFPKRALCPAIAGLFTDQLYPFTNSPHQGGGLIFQTLNPLLGSLIPGGALDKRGSVSLTVLVGQPEAVNLHYRIYILKIMTRPVAIKVKQHRYSRALEEKIDQDQRPIAGL